ncbi:MAG: dephospho-CoA kinase [Pseudomonadota bacterium]
MLKVALTGSIGMGKSTAAKIFSEQGVPVWDADESVRRLYGPGGAAVEVVGELVPEVVSRLGVNRTKLRKAMVADRTLLEKLGQRVHPLVAQDRAAFLERSEEAGAALAICDIPLLFETGADKDFDHVVVVTAPLSVQRERVLARPGMNEAIFKQMQEKQLPDAEKRTRADFVIDTGKGLEEGRRQTLAVLDNLRSLAEMENPFS